MDYRIHDETDEGHRVKENKAEKPSLLTHEAGQRVKQSSCSRGLYLLQALVVDIYQIRLGFLGALQSDI